jgi:zinc/manganese transport system ATP-binding protein
MADKNNKSVIEANKLSAGYGGRIIWNNASFTIKKGDFVGVLGQNGVGKTTLFRLLLGLMQPSGGSLEILGKDPRRGNPKIGYVPQRRPIDSDMTIEALELVRLGVNGDRWGFGGSASAFVERDKAMAALDSVDAGALAHKPLGILSGGELQRVFLAQALVGDVDILLLDEPLANLDVRREVNLVNIINEVVKSRGVTVLLIAHDLNPLLPVLNRVMYVANGSIATGTPKEVVNSETLSSLYGAPIEVLRDSKGRVAVLGTEEAAHHD